MMQRLTTDKPSSNVSSLLNVAYAGEDRRVKLRFADGQEDADLCELMEKMIAEDGRCLCKPTAEHILDGCCFDCDCEYGYLYAAATQAAELRARLMMIEDILGDEYDLAELRGLISSTRKSMPITNADRIRSMTDDELVSFLMCDDICDAMTSPTCMKNGCESCITNWLQQPVKEDAPCTPT